MTCTTSTRPCTAQSVTFRPPAIPPRRDAHAAHAAHAAPVAPVAHPLFKTRGSVSHSAPRLSTLPPTTITASFNRPFLNSPTTAIPHTTPSNISKNIIVGTQVPQLPFSAPGRGRTSHDLRSNVAFCTLRRGRSLSSPILP